MFQKGEFWKITLEIIMLLEFINSMRFGLVKGRVLCLHMFHQMAPWPSIVPFSPMKEIFSNLEIKKSDKKRNMAFDIQIKIIKPNVMTQTPYESNNTMQNSWQTSYGNNSILLNINKAFLPHSTLVPNSNGGSQNKLFKMLRFLQI